MIKTFFIFLSLFQVHSAIIESDDRQKIENLSRNIPNWEDSFVIDGGKATIYHDKNGIKIVSNLVKVFDQTDFFDEISQYHKLCKEIYLTKWFDKILDQPLHLKWSSLRNDFVTELIRSGLYKGTINEQKMYGSSHEWKYEFFVANFSFDGLQCKTTEGKSVTFRLRNIDSAIIEHREEGIVLFNAEGMLITRPIFFCEWIILHNIDGRKIYLNHKQSYHEFIMRLIETDHIHFSQHSFYIKQVGSKGRLCEPLTLEDNPFAKSKKRQMALAEERKRMKQEDNESQLLRAAEIRQEQAQMEQAAFPPLLQEIDERQERAILKWAEQEKKYWEEEGEWQELKKRVEEYERDQDLKLKSSAISKNNRYKLFGILQLPIKTFLKKRSDKYQQQKRIKEAQLEIRTKCKKKMKKNSVVPHKALTIKEGKNENDECA